jgi:hypothetical protein
MAAAEVQGLRSIADKGFIATKENPRSPDGHGGLPGHAAT